MQSSSQIIDNLDQNIGEVIKSNLTRSEQVRFAVGYLFLSGLKDIYKELKDLKEIKILIGNKTSLSTTNALANIFNKEVLQTPAEKKEILDDVGSDYINDIGKEFKQTNEDKDFLNTLYELACDEYRFKIKVYTKATLHAKAYIFGANEKSMTKGQCIIGSSNLSQSGFYDNTELNVIVDGNENYDKMVNWFTRLWDESEDFNKDLIEIIDNSWLKLEPTPYEVYMKVLYELVGEYVENKHGKHDWMDTLFQFQIDAVYQAVGIVKKYGGVFLSDVVGLGKTYTGGIILHLLTRESHTKGLIISPAGLMTNWQDAIDKFGINANIISQDNLDKVIDDKNYDKFKYVLVDESHKFKDKNSNRYVKLQEFIHKTSKQLILLSATPLNLNGWDIYNQIKLFHKGEDTKLPITPSHLYKFFKEYENGKTDISDIMKELMVRRTRLQIKKYYKDDLEKRELAFPDRVGPEIIHYDISKKYEEIYSHIEDVLGKRSPYAGLTKKEKEEIKKNQTLEEKKKREGKLNYAIYFKTQYLVDSCFETDEDGNKKIKDPEFYDLVGIGDNLKELAKIMFFMRIESSPRAFLNTLDRMIKYNEIFLENLKKGFILNTKHSDELAKINELLKNLDDEDDYFELLEDGSYFNIKKFNIEDYKKDIEEDIRLLKELKEKSIILEEIENIKIDKLIEIIENYKDKKILIFTQFSDTAEYLGDSLNNKLKRKDIEILSGKNKNMLPSILGRFSPISQYYKLKNGEENINILVATDVIAEGQNTQDASVVINYDLHWNPVRLIQRIGRIDRIGSKNDKIFIYNFTPSNLGENKIGMETKVSERIEEIHKHIGEENKILKKEEILNEKMLKLFEELNNGNKEKLDEMEEIYEDSNLFTYSSYIKELKDLKNSNKDLYDKIKKLPLRVRTSREGKDKGVLVFCKNGIYEYFYIQNHSGEIINNKTKFLKLLKCEFDENNVSLPQKHDEIVNLIEVQFYNDIKKSEIIEEFSSELSTEIDIQAFKNKITKYKENILTKYDFDEIEKCEKIASFLSKKMEAYQKRKFKKFKKYRKPEELNHEIIEEIFSIVYNIDESINEYDDKINRNNEILEKIIVISESII